jgi:CubicO group peptidase (beta-lactamase class C family)
MIEGIGARLLTAARAESVPGGCLAWSQGGRREIVVFGAADLEDGRPVSERTIFRIGSMTKLITGLVALEQVEAGRLLLDAPVIEVVPELSLADESARRALTLRQLLNHTAGFFGDVLDGPSEGADALEAYARAAGRLEQITPPGACFSYNNAALALAARATEAVAGGPWQSLVARHVIRPLGLRRTGLAWAFPDADVSRAHGPAAGGWRALPADAFNAAMGPAGATAWSTADDILTLGEALLGRGPAPVASRIVAAMTANPYESPIRTFAPYWGLAAQVFGLDPLVFGHDGAVAGQWSFLRVAPAHDLAVVLFLNGGDVRAMSQAAFAPLQEAFGVTLMPEPPAWPAAPTAETDHAGSYAVERYVVDVALEGDALSATMTPRADAGDFAAPFRVELRRQDGDSSGELYLSRAAYNRLSAQQRFTRLPDGRRAMWFRGRLIPEATPGG